MRKNDATLRKLRTLSKEDLIQIIAYLDSRPYCSAEYAIQRLQHKKDMENIDKAEAVSKQAILCRLEYCDLMSPYKGKPITDIPQPVLEQAAKALEQAEKLDKQWDRLMGIK